MSGLLNSSLNATSSNLPDTGRSFASAFSGQSVAGPGVGSSSFHHNGSIQGLHNVHGGFNVPNLPGALQSRNPAINSIPSGGIQQPAGNLPAGRFASNNIPVAFSQLSHGSSLGHSGVVSRGGGINIVGSPGFSGNTNGVAGSIPGIIPTSATIGNRNGVPGLGVSPMLGNAAPRIGTSVGNLPGGGNVGRSINSGGLSVPTLASRLNLPSNSGSASLNIQGQNRLMSSVLPQGSPVFSMLGNSYPISGGPVTQSHMQSVNNLSSIGVLNDANSSENSPFDINADFPQLTSRPSSAGGSQGQLGSLRKQGHGPAPIVQQNQEFSMQTEDFPALPGFKGGNSEYSIDIHSKDKLHDNTMSLMQSQPFSIGRSGGFNLGGAYPSYRPQQLSQVVGGTGVSFSSLNNQDLLHASDIFPSSNPLYNVQSGIGARPMNSPSMIPGIGSYDHLYQHQNPTSQYRLQQQMPTVNQSFRDQGLRSMQGTQPAPDPFGLLGLLSVVRTGDTDLSSLALGIDLMTLGLNLNSSESLHKTFGSPWSDEPAKGDPEFIVPKCYHAKQPPPLHLGYFAKFSVETLFFIFYSMPKDEPQLFAANELYNRGWFYHKEHRQWFIRVPHLEPLVKTNTYERGSYHSFDPSIFEIIRRENFVLHYEMVEKRPVLAHH